MGDLLLCNAVVQNADRAKIQGLVLSSSSWALVRPEQLSETCIQEMYIFANMVLGVCACVDCRPLFIYLCVYGLVRHAVCLAQWLQDCYCLALSGGLIEHEQLS